MRLIKSIHLVYHNLIKEGNNDDDEEVASRTTNSSSSSDVDQVRQEVYEWQQQQQQQQLRRRRNRNRNKKERLLTERVRSCNICQHQTFIGAHCRERESAQERVQVQVKQAKGKTYARPTKFSTPSKVAAGN